MRRREVLVAAALALTGCLRNPPDVTGPRLPPTAHGGGGGAGSAPPTSDLYVRAFDVRASEDGDLTVVGTVANRGDVRRTGTVEATVSAAGETDTRSTRVTVAAGGETRFEIPFALAYESFADDGDVRVSVS